MPSWPWTSWVALASTCSSGTISTSTLMPVEVGELVLDLVQHDGRRRRFRGVADGGALVLAAHFLQDTWSGRPGARYRRRRRLAQAAAEGIAEQARRRSRRSRCRRCPSGAGTRAWRSAGSPNALALSAMKVCLSKPLETHGLPPCFAPRRFVVTRKLCPIPHSLREPKVRPRTSCFWTSRMKMKLGTMADGAERRDETPFRSGRGDEGRDLHRQRADRVGRGTATAGTRSTRR